MPKNLSIRNKITYILRETHLSSLDKCIWLSKKLDMIIVYTKKFIDILKNNWLIKRLYKQFFKPIIITVLGLVIAGLILDYVHPGITTPFISIPLFESKTGQGELSFLIKTPLRILDKDTSSTANIRINDISVSRLYVSPVYVWNSGQLPIENFVMTFSSDNTILDSISNSSPPDALINYGLTRVEKADNFEKYSCTLIRPRDGFTMSFLTSGLSHLKVSSYDKNFGLFNATPTRGRGWF